MIMISGTCGEARASRQGRTGHDLRVRLFDAGLLAGFLEAGQEGFIQRAAGLGFALKFTQTRQFLIVARQGALGSAQGALDRAKTLAGHVHFGLQAADDALGFFLDLTVDVVSFTVDLQHFRIQRAVHRLIFGLLPQNHRLLRPQLTDDFGLQNVAGRVGADAGRDLRTSSGKARFTFGEIAAGNDHLAGNIADLLFGDRRAGRRQKASLRTERFDGAFLVEHFLAQFGQTAGQPSVGAAGRFELRFQLLDEIKLGVAIGDALGFFRVLRRKGQVKDIGHADALGVDALENIVDRRFTAIQRSGAGRVRQTVLRVNARKQLTHAADQAGAAQIRVEFRVVIKTHVFDDAAGQRAREQDLDFRVDNRRVNGQGAQNRLHIQDLSLTRVDHDGHAGGIELRRRRQEQHGGEDHSTRDCTKKAQSPAQDLYDRGQPDGVRDRNGVV